MTKTVKSTQVSTLIRQYNSVATRWQKKITALGYPAAYQTMIFETLNKQPVDQWRVLDAGTGSGSFTHALIHVASSPKSIDLLDLSPNMLIEAKALIAPFMTNIKTYCCGIEELSKNNTYDLILCAHVIEHCTSRQIALEALRNALKPGGFLLLIASKPHWCTTLLRVMWRHKAFKPSVLIKELQQMGFENVTSVPLRSGPPSRTSHGYLAQL